VNENKTRKNLTNSEVSPRYLNVESVYVEALSGVLLAFECIYQYLLARNKSIIAKEGDEYV
jgi:hypothetical protein